MMTRTVVTLPEKEQLSLFSKVINFNRDSDPYKKHDFGSIEQYG